MFAKRHYEAIAKAIQDAQMHIRVNADEQNKCIINLLANLFADDNGMFSRDRFIRACELGANVRRKQRRK